MAFPHSDPHETHFRIISKRKTVPETGLRECSFKFWNENNNLSRLEFWPQSNIERREMKEKTYGV